MNKYSIGLDFGTLSVRALLVDIETGQEVAVSVYDYPHGVIEETFSDKEQLPKGFALQHPKDYMDGLVYVITNAMKKSGIKPTDVVGIGIDFTSSTILPVKEDGTPLCMLEEFAHEPHAYAKLWKHHGGEKEAKYIEHIIEQRKEDWLPSYGGKVSSEWMLPKVLETLSCAPKVYENADRYIEAMDWIAWMLTGQETRSINGVGYKAFYNQNTGYPSKEFFGALDARMENYVEEKMDAPIKKIGEVAGFLSDEMAKKLGLKVGTPVGVPMIDSHCGVLGGGVTKPGEMMIIVGTSICHHIMSEKDVEMAGVSKVKDGIIPGYFSYEAGQSGGGDIFGWFTDTFVPKSYVDEACEKCMGIHEVLCEKLKDYSAGESGVIALDWFNGVRSPLADFDLNGLLLGMNLQTKPEEIYMALIEATGFGTRVIIETFERAGVAIDSIVMSGGIPLKNPRLVQVYADILNREIRVCQTKQAGAYGAAMLGVCAAPSVITGCRDLEQVVQKLDKKCEKVYYPQQENVEVYHKLYEEYEMLSEYFGNGTNDVMKRLNQIRKKHLQSSK